VRARLEREAAGFAGIDNRLQRAVQVRLRDSAQTLDRSRLRLALLDPRLVLQRGYALLAEPGGRPITSVSQTHTGQSLVATLADGEVALTVAPPARV
jgi:exodeoxyribonuclease VII large subunit